MEQGLDALAEEGFPPEDRKFRKELSAGITALALLGIMEGAPGPQYGYSIAKLMEERGRGSWIVKHGALYPVLRSLEAAGLLESTVEPSVSGPPRRYYGITGRGRETLARWRGIWEEAAGFIGGILEGGEKDE